MIYHFRLILDTKEDVFRDIALEETDNFEDFHNAITQAFGFGGSEIRFHCLTLGMKVFVV